MKFEQKHHQLQYNLQSSPRILPTAKRVEEVLKSIICYGGNTTSYDIQSEISCIYVLILNIIFKNQTQV